MTAPVRQFHPDACAVIPCPDTLLLSADFDREVNVSEKATPVDDANRRGARRAHPSTGNLTGGGASQIAYLGYVPAKPDPSAALKYQLILRKTLMIGGADCPAPTPTTTPDTIAHLL